LLSLVGFYTAQALRETEDGVPVGLIEVATGGSKIASWISRERMRADPAVRPLLESYRAAIPFEQKRHAIARSIYEQQVEAARKAGRPEPGEPRDIRFGPRDENHPHRPSGYFYGRVAPFAGLPVRAVIWYQGESDAVNRLGPSHHAAYGRYLEALIEDWRATWEAPSLPFCIVQLPSYGSDEFDYPGIRAGQAEAAEAVADAGLVVTLDTGDPEDIHPVDKRSIGERLATMLGAIVRGEHGWERQGPQLAGFRREGGEVLLEFTNTDSAAVLRNGSSGTPPLLKLIRGTPHPDLPLTGFQWRDAESGDIIAATP
jgi:Domain of unknown function (DUF303).